MSFLVWIKPLSGLGGHGFGDRNGLHEAQQGNDRGKWQQLENCGYNRYGVISARANLLELLPQRPRRPA